MNTVIWKYEIELKDEFFVMIPQWAKVIHVDVQRGTPFMWATVSPIMAKEKRKFFLIGTGHEFDGEGMDHLGSFQLREGALVFHLFQRWVKR